MMILFIVKLILKAFKEVLNNINHIINIGLSGILIILRNLIFKNSVK